jgi:pilus assembly protein CpaB
VPAPGARGALALVTRPGMRAVLIGLTPTTGVSGLIMPGDHVDVVLTYVLPRDSNDTGADRRGATTILTDLRVLAIDQRLASSPDEVKEIKNASLEVTAKQSETLALAADLGKLSLSLRSLRTERTPEPDATGGSTMDYQVAALLRRAATPAPRPAAPASAAPAAPRPAAPAITELRGGKTNSGTSQ